MTGPIVLANSQRSVALTISHGGQILYDENADESSAFDPARQRG